MTDDVYTASVALHKKYGGKLEVRSKVPVTNREELALAYTPGVAEPCRVIARDEQASFELTMRGRTVAVVSDGSAVLGLGNIGPAAALPVMEGKALLLKEFAGVDAIPLVVDTQDPQELVDFVKRIRHNFAGINLEDIAAPRCFQIEDALQDIGIPVFHDDQHGTAIVVTAALHNAAKVVGKKYTDLRVVVVGAGAAGLATARMLLGVECRENSCELITGAEGVGDVIVVDSQGALVKFRSGMNIYKQALAGFSNRDQRAGSLADVIKGVDVVVGVSGPGTITSDMVKNMASKAIVFAMANPVPEIMPVEALEAGAAVVATGRSDFANQINNVLAFPGLFKGALQARVSRISMPMKLAAAQTLASLVEQPSVEYIIPEPFDPRVVEAVAAAVRRFAPS